MHGSTLDRLAYLLCPARLRGFAQRLRKSLLVRLGKMRTVSSLAELDAEIARLDAIRDSSQLILELRRLLFKFPWVPPAAPPESGEYRDSVMDSYKLYSGRDSYSAPSNEVAASSEELSAQCPYPYSSGSSLVIGEHLMSIGFLMKALDLAAGMSILEFGPGWGGTTLEFARSGCPVTAVDINPAYLRVVKERTQGMAVPVDVACSDMLDFEPTRRFDRIVFFECFHHCSDPVRMLDRLAGWLAPGGKVVFAGEPITDGFPIPWGLRTDGQSAYCIRRFGWLELGFNTSFFTRLLSSRGWRVSKFQSLDQLHVSVFSASRTAAHLLKAA